MKFRVLMMPQAEADFERQLDYLLDRSPQGFDVYQFVFRTKNGNPYRILYEINESTVFILTIRGLGQNFYE